MKEQSPDPESFSRMLKDAGKEMPYKVPEGYFEAFPGRIMARVKEQDSRPIRGIYYAWMGKAAAIAGLLILGATAWLYLDSPFRQSLNTLSKVDIQSLPIEEVDEELLLEELAFNTAPSDSIPSEEIETYLMESVEEELLIQQL